MIITKHAQKQLKKRQGLSKSAQSNLIDKVLAYGLTCENTHGQLREYLERKQENSGVRFYIYGEFVYVVALTKNIIVTSFKLHKTHLKKAISLQKKLNISSVDVAS